MEPVHDVPSVRDVWRLALPLETRLVAGQVALSRPVRWARTSSHTPPFFPGLSAEELALLDLEAARSFNPSLRLVRVITSLAQVPVSAVAVLQPTGAEARAAAEEAGIALFEMPAGTDLQRVARSVVRLLSDPEAQEETRAGELLRRFTTQVTSGGGLDTVLTDLAALTGHVAQLRLAEGTSLRRTPSGRVPSDATERVSVPVLVGDQTIGETLLRDVADAFDRFSLMAAKQGAAAFALELAKQQAVTEAQQALQADLLDAVLANEAPAVVRARARSLGYDLDANHVVLIAETEASPKVLSLWGRRVAELTKSHGWEALVVLHEGRLVLLAGTQNGQFAGESSWLEELRTTWTNGPLTLSLGDPGEGLGGLKQSLRQAEAALGLGVRLFGHGRTFRYGELGLYRLFRHLQGRRELFDFYEDVLAPLNAYDKAHNAELIETLRTLLAHGGNISQAAQALHLHRNSLSYRIDRIREIAGLDPLDPDDAFHMRLALYLAPLVEGSS